MHNTPSNYDHLRFGEERIHRVSSLQPTQLPARVVADNIHKGFVLQRAAWEFQLHPSEFTSCPVIIFAILLWNTRCRWSEYVSCNHQQWWFWPHPNRFSMEQTSHAHNLLTCYSKYTHSILHASTSYISISFFCPSLTFINLFVGRMSLNHP